MHKVREEATKYFQPLQIGIATSGGVEAMVHTTRKLQQLHGQDGKFALLQVDLKNAVNLVSRSSFLLQVKEHFPTLLPWVQYCYAGDPARLWCGEDMFLSVTGVQQGDPLGPLLFSAALHTVLKELKTILEGLQSEREDSKLLMNIFYLDDGAIIATHDLLQTVLHFFASQQAKEHGPHLGMDKC